MVGNSVKQEVLGEESNRRKLNAFLYYLLAQRDQGLLVVQDLLMQEVKLFIAATLPIVGVATQEELHYALNYGMNSLIEVEPQTSTKLMKDIRQCSVRIGALQTVHPVTHEVITIQYDPLICHILMLVALSEYPVVEKIFSLKQHVGMIEFI